MTTWNPLLHYELLLHSQRNLTERPDELSLIRDLSVDPRATSSRRKEFFRGVPRRPRR
jgi:hypothetical protein